MPGIQIGLNDSDCEEMDQEPAESEKSSHEETDSSPGSDEDDSSDMDEETCEFRRTVCIEDMADLEKYFVYLKERLYVERIAQTTSKLTEVRIGRAEEYIQPLKELQESIKIRTEVAGILKELRQVNIKNIYDAEKSSTHQNFENDKNILMDKIKGELQEKVRKLEEDRNNIDISSDIWKEHLSSKKNRKKYLDYSNLERRRKPVIKKGYIDPVTHRAYAYPARHIKLEEIMLRFAEHAVIESESPSRDRNFYKCKGHLYVIYLALLSE
ncbi:Breast cancer metastasis-suppressor 1-like protein-A [Nymphon striatum]|nr:Breast cancer metastasis-suppressor 1-like protein-A [Nymphon striatum]